MLQASWFAENVTGSVTGWEVKYSNLIFVFFFFLSLKQEMQA